MYTVPTLKLTLEGANKIIEAALEEAKAKGRKIGVAVVDVGGNLIAFARMDGASVTTISVAQNKARCAAFTGHPSGKSSKAGNERSDHHALAITMAAGMDKMVTLEGGIPIKVDGQLVGGVAISGAGHSDGEIGQIAVAAIG